MKKKYLAILLCFIASPLFAFEDTVLVLGTDTRDLSDVEDQLLRDAVMREILKSGGAVVPVMEVEREIQLNNTDIRKISENGMWSIATNMNSHWCIKGTNLNRNKGYYSLLVLDLKMRKKSAIEIPFPKNVTFPDYCGILAKRISQKTIECRQQNGNK